MLSGNGHKCVLHMKDEADSRWTELFMANVSLAQSWASSNGEDAWVQAGELGMQAATWDLGFAARYPLCSQKCIASALHSRARFPYGYKYIDTQPSRLTVCALLAGNEDASGCCIQAEGFASADLSCVP